MSAREPEPQSNIRQPPDRAAISSDARAYGGPAHGQEWTVDPVEPPPWVELHTGFSSSLYRLARHPRTGRPARDYLGNLLYVPITDVGPTKDTRDAARILAFPGTAPPVGRNEPPRRPRTRDRTPALSHRRRARPAPAKRSAKASPGNLRHCVRRPAGAPSLPDRPPQLLDSISRVKVGSVGWETGQTLDTVVTAPAAVTSQVRRSSLWPPGPPVPDSPGHTRRAPLREVRNALALTTRGVAGRGAAVAPGLRDACPPPRLRWNQTGGCDGCGSRPRVPR